MKLIYYLERKQYIEKPWYNCFSINIIFKDELFIYVSFSNKRGEVVVKKVEKSIV